MLILGLQILFFTTDETNLTTRHMGQVSPQPFLTMHHLEVRLLRMKNSESWKCCRTTTPIVFLPSGRVHSRPNLLYGARTTELAQRDGSSAGWLLMRLDEHPSTWKFLRSIPSVLGLAVWNPQWFCRAASLSGSLLCIFTQRLMPRTGPSCQRLTNAGWSTAGNRSSALVPSLSCCPLAT